MTEHPLLFLADHWRAVDIHADIPQIGRSWATAFPNFHPREIACRASGAVAVDLYSLMGLQASRTHWGRAYRLTSAYRSPAHNAAVGGGEASQHLITTAYDIEVSPSDGPALEAVLRAHGARGIGRYPAEHFIHADWRIGRAATWGSWS